MTTLFLDVCLFLALAVIVLLTSIRGQSWGPEGPVGLHIAVFPPVLLIGLALAACIGRGKFDWVPGARLSAYLLLLGVLVGVTTLIFASFDQHQNIGSVLAAGAPYALLAAAAYALHAPEESGWNGFRVSSAVVLGTLALGGWALMTYGLVTHLNRQLQQAEAQARRTQEQEAERAAHDLTEFRKLAADAALWQLLQYVHSPNESIQKESRDRIANLPDLEDQLNEMLGNGWSEYAASYIARVQPAPTAKLAPAYAKFLESQLKSWPGRLDGSPNPGMWQPNLSPFFDAADRIQMAGGDLRPQLQAWRDYLKTVSGMGGLAMHIQEIAKRPAAAAGR